MNGRSVRRVVVTVIPLCVLSLPLAAVAQDDPGSVPGQLHGTRSSPFDPPTEDVFLTDEGPGLDTGCTFNTDPEHPLIIDVLIDQAVGEVDGNGFLVDPAELVAAGIVPATIEVIMPAYDVDVNGAPPPERDEVLLNGQFLGTLTGDNNIWKLNSFSVPIGEIKFPPPSQGTCSPAVANRIQINVDTLSVGRWCTAIDWVALVIPIQLKTAIKLEPTAGNKIRVRDYSLPDTIDTIYEQSFDADCDLTTDIGDGDEDDYPFSGPARKLFGLLTGTARLHATLENCPCRALPAAEVVVGWEIGGTSLSGVTSWSGSEGDIDLTMPAEVGDYNVELTFTIDGEGYPPIDRKLLVTRRSPLKAVAPPRLGWLEKAVDWASGEKDEGPILAELLGGLYSFGGTNWRYIDSNDCNWKALVRDPITCDYANCFIFSDVLEKMAATLGVGGLSPAKPRGSQNQGFLTDAAPSLDPAFPGNAKRLGSSTYDRYLFGIHSLRRKSLYYDATFNGIYASSTEFITANLTGGLNTDADGAFYETVEGWNIYDLGGISFYSWGDYAYKEPPPPITNLNAQFAPMGMVSKTRGKTTDIEFTGNVTFDLIDDDLDGLAEALKADVEVQLNTAGEYTVIGQLFTGGQLIANRPAWESMRLVRATLDEISGTYTVPLEFSGEQILRSEVDGPYDLMLEGIAGTGSASATLATPAYDHTLFGEVDAHLTGVAEAAVDDDGDGEFDYLEVIVDLEVQLDGDFALQGALDKDGQTIVDAGAAVNLTAKALQVALQFDGGKIRSSGIDGPYDGSVNLIDAEGHTIDGITLTTAPYTAASFSGLLELLGTSSDQGIDTNGNGLFDFLRVEFDAEIEEAGSYLLTGLLRGAGGAAVSADLELAVAAGPTTIGIDFSGPEIHTLELDGPYTVEVILRDPTTLADLAAVELPEPTAAYSYTDFDPYGASGQPIVLTGNSNDFGVDTDGNGRFDELHVEVEVALTNSDFYEWSARLEDANNTEIGFYTGQSFLDSGLRDLLFVFDGNPIGSNGVDGPYFVKGLLIFGSTTGANLVSVEVATTQPYLATDFEGAQVDLSITKSSSPSVAIAGSNLTYWLTVTNLGSAASTGATVTDPLPAGVTFDSSSDCTEDEGTVTCAIGPQALGMSQSVSFEVAVDPAQTAPLINTATVVGNEADLDPEPSNNSDTTTTEVAQPGDVVFFDGFESGDTSTWSSVNP